MSIKRKLASNAIYLFLEWISSTVFAVIFWTIIAKTYLPEISGIISTATNLAVTIGGISLLGLSDAVHKLIPEYLQRKEKSKIIGLIHYSIKIIFTISFVASIMFFVFSEKLTLFLNIPADAIRAVSLFIVSYSLFFLTSCIVRGFQHMKNFMLINSIGYIGKILFLAVFIVIGANYLGAIFAYFLSILLIVAFRLNYTFLKSIPGKIDKKVVMIDFAFPAFLTTIITLLIRNGQYILLTILSNASETGLFTIAMLISSPILILPSILSLAISPILSQLSVGRNKRLQGYLIKSVFRYVIFLCLPFSILIVTFSKNLIFLFSRVEYLPAVGLFPIISVASILYAAGDVFYSGLYATGKTKIQRNITVISGVVFLLISIPLTSMFASYGMSVSYAVAMFLTTFLSYFYIRKSIKIKLEKSSLVKTLISSIVLIVFLYLISEFVYGLISVVFFAIVGITLYLLLLLPLKFYREEDIKVIRFLAEKVPALKKPLNKVADGLSKFVKN